jgi:hypothetical protein
VFALPFGFTLTVRRYGPSDRYGNRPPPTTHAVEHCAAAPAGSIERTDGETLTLDSDTIYAPFDADVKPTDELVVPDGLPIEPGTYQVDGRPQRWASPFTGEAFGMVIRLTRASGS